MARGLLICLSGSALGGCLQPSIPVRVVLGSGQSETFTRIGAQFTFSQNQVLAVEEAGLTSFRTSGLNYVRWTFAVRPQSTSPLVSLTVADVTSDPVVWLVRDERPQLGEGRWTGQSALIRATAEQVPWLFSNDDTIRVFRVSARFADGQTSTLDQATRFTPKDKEQLRELMGPEIPGSS